MKSAYPYLMFNGNCEEAINHYAKCFNTKAEILPFEKGQSEGVMHSSIQSGNFMVMASDWPGPGYQFGNNGQIYVDCESQEEVNKLHKSLGEGGKSNMNPDNVPWGSYFGMVTDKFGINWMMGFDTAKK